MRLRADFEHLEVGQKILVNNSADAKECAEKIKEKGFGYSFNTGINGNYVEVKEPGYENEESHDGEVTAYGVVLFENIIFKTSRVKYIKELDGFLGITPFPRGIVIIFETENNMKSAYNLMKHKGWKVAKGGTLYVGKEFVDEQD